MSNKSAATGTSSSLQTTQNSVIGSGGVKGVAGGGRAQQKSNSLSAKNQMSKTSIELEYSKFDISSGGGGTNGGI